MKRILLGLGAIVLVALVVWRACREDTQPRTQPRAPVPTPVVRSRAVADPAKVARGSLGGTVLDEDRRPVANARVCAIGASETFAAELFREPACATTDARGAYTIERVLPARYTLTASARSYEPAARVPLRLREGEQARALDFVLRGGGVELAGIVEDLTGGPVARAHVSAIAQTAEHDATVTTETDEHGRFSLWVAPGVQRIVAAADGYADAITGAVAPERVEILLTPEGAIAGKLVDAVTNHPVAGARVVVAGLDWTTELADSPMSFSDAGGAFRFTRLPPGRVTIVATTEHGFGRSAGSINIALGQHVDAGVIEMVAARQVAGKVVVAKTGTACADATVSLRDDARDRHVILRSRDEHMTADGVLPGTYKVQVTCKGFASRDSYEPAVVADADLKNLVWEVVPGVRVRGKIRTKGGTPVARVQVFAWRDGVLDGDVKSADSLDDGSYVLEGLGAGAWVIFVRADRNESTRIAIADVDLEHDLVLAEVGSIEGTVVDGERKPLAGETIRAKAPPDAERGPSETSSDRTGTFRFRALPPGEYELSPGKRRVVVHANEVATVTLVVDAKRGAITGTVVDADRKPIADAFVVAVPQAAASSLGAAMATRWAFGQRPVVTATDGTFALGNLEIGQPYAVRAFRKGGGEVVVENVAVGTTIELQIRPTSSFAGIARRADGTPVDELTLRIEERTTGVSRTERYSQTAGRFVVRDLPRGRYSVVCEADRGWKHVEVELGDGDDKTGIDLVLEPLLTVTGKVVDLRTRAPLAGIDVSASPAVAAGYDSYKGTHRVVTDGAGRFTLERVPPGRLQIDASSNREADGYYGAAAVHAVAADLDIGELALLKARVTGDAPTGTLGFSTETSKTPIEHAKITVTDIDDEGPAATSGLVVGDVITAVDGLDVQGTRSAHFLAATEAPPGTKLAFRLARGATITITLGAAD